MDIHKNARLTFKMREQMAKSVVDQGVTLKQAAACFNVSVRTAAKWVGRYREWGSADLKDRSSRPHRLHRPTSSQLVEQVTALRRQRFTGLHIARHTGLSRATVSRILRRAKLSRARDLEPILPIQRYEHKAPGDLLHLDIKKLGRIAQPGHRVTGNPADRTRRVGWEYLHVAIDDHSRLSFADLYPNEQGVSVVQFLEAALRHYARYGIRITAVLTDNGPAYRSRLFAQACRLHGLKHRYTKPYTPRTNGKAERFIQTALREWAYARPYQNSTERTHELPDWLHRYNWHRPHASLGLSPPITRSGLDRNNLLTLHT
jgi:transposase InsO family protein